MIRVKRTTYAAGPGNDEIQKISLEIKQVIKLLQDDALKIDKLLHNFSMLTEDQIPQPLLQTEQTSI